MNCPCCACKLLRHVDRNGLYWYCTDCRQTMPVSPEISQWQRAPKSRSQIWLYIPLKSQSPLPETA
ncbi:hypothetical protein [Lusitaniella coriacea]|uniref:hypothetical protein n=1 Tax=Lusitaniella coriacea TaxID=1983105 RepID=UPI003CEB061F